MCFVQKYISGKLTQFENIFNKKYILYKSLRGEDMDSSKTIELLAGYEYQTFLILYEAAMLF